MIDCTELRGHTDTAVLLIHCHECRGWNALVHAGYTVWCVEARRGDFLYTCDSWQLEGELWHQLVRSLQLDRVTIFYDTTSGEFRDRSVNLFISTAHR